MVCHSLLVVLPDKLVLVDAGMSKADNAEPSRLGPARFLAGFNLDDTAFDAIVRAGFDPADVRDILLTHLDIDHAGGISDFPDATIHVHEDELAAASARQIVPRYQTKQWAHGPKWAPFGSGGEAWNGFAAARDLTGLPPEILAIPTPGHSPGHAAIAVEGERWLLHCGDAWFHHREMEQPPWCSVGLRAFQRVTEWDHRQRVANQARLRELTGVAKFCAHDPDEYLRLSGAASLP